MGLFLAVAWVLGASRGAQAQERHARAFLAWDGSLDVHGCGPRARIVTEIEARLGRPLGAARREDAELVLEARAVEGLDGRALGAALTLRRPGGEILGVRRIATDDAACTTLDEGLPLVIALLVDLHEREALLRLPAPSAAQGSSRASSAAQGSPRASPSSAQGRSGDALRASLEGGVSLDVGALPDPALACELLATLGPRRSAVALAARAAVVVPRTHEAAAPGAVRIWGARGALGVSWAGPPAAVLLEATALVEAGWLRVEGRAFDVPREADALHVAAVAMVGVSLLELAPWSLRVEVGGSVPVVAQRLWYEDDLGVHEFFASSPVSFRAGLALGLRSP